MATIVSLYFLAIMALVFGDLLFIVPRNRAK